jgi:hypothetical protein
VNVLGNFLDILYIAFQLGFKCKNHTVMFAGAAFRLSMALASRKGKISNAWLKRQFLYHHLVLCIYIRVVDPHPDPDWIRIQ